MPSDIINGRNDSTDASALPEATETAAREATHRPVLYQDTISDIRTDIAESTKEGRHEAFTFFFCDPEEGSYRFWEEEALGIGHSMSGKSEAVDLAVRLFEGLGCDVDYGDTVDFSFSLNRCWWSATYDKCIRSFGYTLPISDDVDSLAMLVHYVAKGNLQMVVMPA